MCAHAMCMRTHTCDVRTHTIRLHTRMPYVCARIAVPRNPKSFTVCSSFVFLYIF